MKIIDRIDIESWSGRYEAKGNFPYLISRLVYVTSAQSTQIDIPSGSAAYVGGWDGIVRSEKAVGYIPEGISLWEFGTDSAVKGKADNDYNKRTSDTLGYTASECTFVFVTPRFWSKKDKWRQAKIAEGIWKDVQVYDSSDLEQWLGNAHSVATWFATQVNKLPFDGVLTADQFWFEWSEGSNGVLSPQTVTSGRDIEMQKLLQFLSDNPGIIAIKASTKDEAIAFVIGAARQFELALRDRFFSKTLLVDTEGNFRAIHTNSQASLNIIPKMENTLPLYAAVSNGHHVIVPLGGDDTINQPIITLPTIRKEGQIAGLVEMGLSREDAEKYSRESGRNITILRRLLGFPQNTAIWYKDYELREIVPALLLGRWNQNNVGDREILENLSGLSYDDYLPILIKWRDLQESPILQIGDTWRLTSPFDLWSGLSNILTENDFKLLSNNFLLAFGNDNATEDESSEIFEHFTKPKKFSSWAKEGLTQSLILIGKFGDDLNISNIASPQIWVDTQVGNLLNDAEGDLWTSINHHLPLISEASPRSFFKAVYDSLKKECPPIMEMFEEKPGLIGGSSNHTGLLWALEGLAWLPEYLSDSTSILLKLSDLDPGGNLVNRPLNSLVEIYKAWHHQTLAVYDERMSILKQAIATAPSSGWDLLIRLLPESHGHASPTHKMRWRLFDKNTNLHHTYAESDDTYSFIIDLILSQFDNSETKFTQLIEQSVQVHRLDDNEKILSFFENEYQKIISRDSSARNAIRKILSRHRSYPDTDWALPEEILLRYESLYNNLEPLDTILKYRWLFDDWHIEFPDGKFKDEDGDENYKKHNDRLDSFRIEGLSAIKETYGFEKILELGFEVKEPSTIGQTLAKMPLSDKEIFTIFELLTSADPNQTLVQQFVLIKFFSNGLDWILNIYHSLKREGFGADHLVQLFITLPHSKTLWDFIDATGDGLRERYWMSVRPSFYHNTDEEKILGLTYLLEYNRFFSAIDAAYMMKESIPSDLILKILQKAGTEKASESINIKEYEISTLFEILNSDPEIEEDNLSQLEWYFLPVLSSYGTRYNPKKLHKKLATDPAFFIEVLKWVYLPKDESIRDKEREGIDKETLRNFAEQGYRLLSNWKTIPGMDIKGNIDGKILSEWIDKVRVLAQEANRIEIADMQIGQLLAQYPENNAEYWPPDEISEVIERIHSESLIDNFSIATTNKRGFTSRGPYDGGAIERANSSHFKKLAELHKHSYPTVSRIFEEISSRYLDRAKEEDEQAERDRLEH